MKLVVRRLKLSVFLFILGTITMFLSLLFGVLSLISGTSELIVVSFFGFLNGAIAMGIAELLQKK
ncbi:hypothetical protein [Chengkuizengella axinellae]|uniref:Uncharacterized protein n=1 Tax=Chengkuizengella axinellae TaxID=3064388 RepID=A0ABT9J472_9BACL|nr:hypothetical protein [Chengkuizengella sp. 2205SS18-9]MDP5276436.1 hypothetical protein [Chengkuizengella sp. 2205SS18-9]